MRTFILSPPLESQAESFASSSQRFTDSSTIKKKARTKRKKFLPLSLSLSRAQHYSTLCSELSLSLLSLDVLATKQLTIIIWGQSVKIFKFGDLENFFRYILLELVSLRMCPHQSSSYCCPFQCTRAFPLVSLCVIFWVIILNCFCQKKENKTKNHILRLCYFWFLYQDCT